MPHDDRNIDPETLGAATRVTVAEGVLSREVDGETVLVHLERGVYYGLDEVGTWVWQWMGEFGRLDAVLKAMLEQYEVEESRARQDLYRLVVELAENGLVVVEDGAGTDA